MKRPWIAAAVVILLGAALIVVKEAGRSASQLAATGSAASSHPQIVLVADPREAASACGCGEIIRLVRQAGSEGVAVMEIPPGSAEAQHYRALANPTVLFLDQAGTITARYEGEGRATIAAIRQQLARAGAK